MSEFFSLNYSGAPFVLFGPAHLAGLAVVIVLNLAIVLLSAAFILWYYLIYPIQLQRRIDHRAKS